MNNIKSKHTEPVCIQGVYKFTKAKIETLEQQKLQDKIIFLRNKGCDFIHLVRKLNKICKTEVLEFENIIPTCGRKLIANNLTASSPDNTMLVDYIALGTGNTAVANGDTTLETEVYRNTTASHTNADNIAYVTGFYSATECNGTYTEAGIFCDATGAADSGILLSHVLLNSGTGIAKSNVETLTIDWSLTLS